MKSSSVPSLKLCSTLLSCIFFQYQMKSCVSVCMRKSGFNKQQIIKTYSSEGTSGPQCSALHTTGLVSAALCRSRWSEWSLFSLLPFQQWPKMVTSLHQLHAVLPWNCFTLPGHERQVGARSGCKTDFTPWACETQSIVMQSLLKK